MEPKDKLDHALRLVANQLTKIYKTWSVEHGVVRGPGTLEVRVEDLHRCDTNHLDIGFVLNRERADAPVLWDCATGLGATTKEGVSHTVQIWATSTLPVFLEFLTRDGSFADHFHGDDPRGCRGWHVIHGPWLPYGVGLARDILLAWALETPVLSLVGPIIARSFDRPELNCVKLFFGFGGSDIAEVRVNGQRDEVASEHLESLPWPRSKDAAFARCVLLFVHAE